MMVIVNGTIQKVKIRVLIYHFCHTFFSNIFGLKMKKLCPDCNNRFVYQNKFLKHFHIPWKTIIPRKSGVYKHRIQKSETKSEFKLQKTEPVNFPELPCSSRNIFEPKHALEVKPKVNSKKKRKIKHPI